MRHTRHAPARHLKWPKSARRKQAGGEDSALPCAGRKQVSARGDLGEVDRVRYVKETPRQNEPFRGHVGGYCELSESNCTVSDHSIIARVKPHRF
jgi:hypothetical protein